MPKTDLHQPDLGPLRAAAEAAELAQAVSGLVSANGCRLADSGPLAPLARDIARSMTEAGLPCTTARDITRCYRLGGICVLAGTCRTGRRPRRDRGVLDPAQPGAAGLGPVRHLHRHPAGHEHGARRRAARLRVPGRRRSGRAVPSSSPVTATRTRERDDDRARRPGHHSRTCPPQAAAWTGRSGSPRRPSCSRWRHRGIHLVLARLRRGPRVRRDRRDRAVESATIDGLVYASSMVMLYAARHRLPVPPLARWMLALGIVASLAVNVAQGWSHGLVGAVVAAWPAVSLVGSYELLAWIIRTAATGGPDHVPAADHHRPAPDHTGTGPWPTPGPVPDAGPANRYEQVTGLAPVIGDNPLPQVPAAVADPRTGAGLNVPDHPDHPDQAADHGDQVDQVPAGPPAAGDGSGGIGINAAAVAAYRASVQDGQPISERKLAEMFGKTSRRWARGRMAEARQSLAPV